MSTNVQASDTTQDDEIRFLRQQNQALLDRLEAVERVLAPSLASQAPDAGLSRRRLLRRAGAVAVAGAAAIAAGGVVHTTPARAGATDGGGLKLASTSNTASAATGLTATIPTGQRYGLGVSDSDLSAIPGPPTGEGTIAGHAGPRMTNGVLGYHGADGNGVRGMAAGPDGWGVMASGLGARGIGVWAEGPRTGGRGGVFAGGAAQIQLTPGTRATHPVKGSRGDLYVDKTGRLWFCKKSGDPATWKLIG